MITKSKACVSLKREIHRFPAHDHISGASKIPTIIYYDRNGDVKAVGAEALRDGVQEQAEDEQWVKVEWCVASLFIV